MPACFNAKHQHVSLSPSAKPQLPQAFAARPLLKASLPLFPSPICPVAHQLPCPLRSPRDQSASQLAARGRAGRQEARGRGAPDGGARRREGAAGAGDLARQGWGVREWDGCKTGTGRRGEATRPRPSLWSSCAAARSSRGDSGGSLWLHGHLCLGLFPNQGACGGLETSRHQHRCRQLSVASDMHLNMMVDQSTKGAWRRSNTDLSSRILPEDCCGNACVFFGRTQAQAQLSACYGARICADSPLGDEFQAGASYLSLSWSS